MKAPTIKALVPEVIKDLEKGLTFNESAERLKVIKTNKSTLKKYVREATDLPLEEPKRYITVGRNEKDEIGFEPLTFIPVKKIEIKQVEVKGKTYYDVTPFIVDCGG